LTVSKIATVTALRQLYKVSQVQVFQGSGLKNIYPLYMLFDVLLESARKYFTGLLQYFILVKMEQTVLNTCVCATALYTIYVETDLCQS